MPVGRPKGSRDKSPRRYNPKSRQNLTPGWLPGVSGNPGGRPKTDREFKERVDSAVDEALNVVIHVMKSETAMPQTRFAAAAFLIERSKGKPNANVNVTRKRDVTELGDDELAALAESGEVGTGATSQGDGQAGTGEAPSSTNSLN